MKIRLGENIKENRKRLNLTQEKLAEALGVTVGAVHKWESGISAPELSMLIKIAAFFEISVDVLLGYEIKNNSLDSMIKLINESSAKKDEAGIEYADTAVKKYPNNFEIMYRSAKLYMFFGIGKNNRELLNKSIDCFEKSLALISQNKDHELNGYVIMNNIANVYICLGNYKKGLNILKENNPSGMNNALIGSLLSGQLGEMDEAETYLSWSLSSNFTTLVTIYTGFLPIYIKRKSLDDLNDLTRLVINYLEGLKKGKGVSHIDKILGPLYCVLSYTLWNKDVKESEKLMKKALKISTAFDAAPDYSSGNFKFVRFDKDYMGYDSLGDSSLTVIENFVKDKEKKFVKFYEGLKAEIS